MGLANFTSPFFASAAAAAIFVLGHLRINKEILEAEPWYKSYKAVYMTEHASRVGVPVFALATGLSTYLLFTHSPIGVGFLAATVFAHLAMNAVSLTQRYLSKRKIAVELADTDERAPPQSEVGVAPAFAAGSMFSPGSIFGFRKALTFAWWGEELAFRLPAFVALTKLGGVAGIAIYAAFNIAFILAHLRNIKSYKAVHPNSSNAKAIVGILGVPAMVSLIISAAILPLAISSPLLFMGLSMVTHLVTNLFVKALPSLKLWSATIAPEIDVDIVAEDIIELYPELVDDALVEERIYIPGLLGEYFKKMSTDVGTSLEILARAKDIIASRGLNPTQRINRMRSKFYELFKESLERLPDNRDQVMLFDLQETMISLYVQLLRAEGIRGDVDKQEQLDRLFAYVYEKLLDQDEDDQMLPYTPHGAKHSSTVADYMIKIARQTPGLMARMMGVYGPATKPLIYLLGLLHDVGYAGLQGAAAKLGKKKLPKGYHADLGAQMMRGDLRSVFESLFDMGREGSRPGLSAFDDFVDAILLHGADKKDIETEGPEGSGKHAYTTASEVDNPFLLLLRMADNLDVSRIRLRKWQTNPLFIRMLHHITHDEPLEAIREDKGLTEDERNKRIDERLEKLRAEELKKLRRRRELALRIQEGEVALEELSKEFDVDNEEELRIIFEQLLGTTNEDFALIERNIMEMDHETFFHFIGAVAIRELRFTTDDEGSLRVEAVVTKWADDPKWRKFAEFQIRGEGRSKDALESLSINGKTVEIDIVYEHVRGGKQEVWGDSKKREQMVSVKTVGFQAFKNIDIMTVHIKTPDTAAAPTSPAAGSWRSGIDWIQKAFLIEAGIPLGLAAVFMFFAPTFFVPIIAGMLFAAPHLRYDSENKKIYLAKQTSWPVVGSLSVATGAVSALTLLNPLIGIAGIAILMIVHRRINRAYLGEAGDEYSKLEKNIREVRLTVDAADEFISEQKRGLNEAEVEIVTKQFRDIVSSINELNRIIEENVELSQEAIEIIKNAVDLYNDEYMDISNRFSDLNLKGKRIERINFEVQEKTGIAWLKAQGNLGQARRDRYFKEYLKNRKAFIKNEGRDPNNGFEVVMHAETRYEDFFKGQLSDRDKDLVNRFVEGKLEGEEAQEFVGALTSADNKLYYNSEGELVNLEEYLKDYYSALGTDIKVEGIVFKETPVGLRKDILRTAVRETQLGKNARYMADEIIDAIEEVMDGKADLEEIEKYYPEVVGALRHLIVGNTKVPHIVIRAAGEMQEVPIISIPFRAESNKGNNAGFAESLTDVDTLKEEGRQIFINTVPGNAYRQLADCVATILHEVDHAVSDAVQKDLKSRLGYKVNTLGQELASLKVGLKEGIVGMFKAWIKSIRLEWEVEKLKKDLDKQWKQRSQEIERELYMEEGRADETVRKFFEFQAGELPYLAFLHLDSRVVNEVRMLESDDGRLEYIVGEAIAQAFRERFGEEEYNKLFYRTKTEDLPSVVDFDKLRETVKNIMLSELGKNKDIRDLAEAQVLPEVGRKMVEDPTVVASGEGYEVKVGTFTSERGPQTKIAVATYAPGEVIVSPVFQRNIKSQGMLWDQSPMHFVYQVDGTEGVQDVVGKDLRKDVMTIEEHLAEFKRLHPELEVIAYVGNGNVLANNHLIGYVGGKLYGVEREKELIRSGNSRRYPSVIMWTDGNITMEEVIFTQAEKPVRVSTGRPIGDSEVFAINSGVGLLRGTEMYDLADNYEHDYDIRHYLDFPFINTGKITFGMSQFRENGIAKEEMMKKALAGERVTLTLTESGIALTDQQISDLEDNLKNEKKYNEAEEPVSVEEVTYGTFFIDKVKGEITIGLKRGIHPNNILAMDENGNLVSMVVAGLSSRVGITYKEAQEKLKEMGMTDAIVFDNGADAMMNVNGEDVISSFEGRDRFLSILVFARPRIASQEKEPDVEKIVEGEPQDRTSLLLDTLGLTGMPGWTTPQGAPKAILINELGRRDTNDAYVFRGRVDGVERDVAVRVAKVLDPANFRGREDGYYQQTIDKRLEEFQSAQKMLERLSDTEGVNVTKTFGYVGLRGNLAFATELVEGVDFLAGKPNDLLEAINGRTKESLERAIRALYADRIYPIDLQFMVLLRDQVVNGRSLKKGEIVIIDVGKFKGFDDEFVQRVFESSGVKEGELGFDSFVQSKLNKELESFDWNLQQLGEIGALVEGTVIGSDIEEEDEVVVAEVPSEFAAPSIAQDSPQTIKAVEEKEEAAPIDLIVESLEGEYSIGRPAASREVKTIEETTQALGEVAGALYAEHANIVRVEEADVMAVVLLKDEERTKKLTGLGSIKMTGVGSAAERVITDGVQNSNIVYVTTMEEAMAKLDPKQGRTASNTFFFIEENRLDDAEKASYEDLKQEAFIWNLNIPDDSICSVTPLGFLMFSLKFNDMLTRMEHKWDLDMRSLARIMLINMGEEVTEENIEEVINNIVDPISNAGDIKSVLKLSGTFTWNLPKIAAEDWSQVDEHFSAMLQVYRAL